VGSGAGYPTQLEKRDPMLELALCQRFFLQLPNLTPISTYVSGSYAVYGQIIMPVAMRATPTIAFYSSAYTNSSGAASAGNTPVGAKVSVLSTATGPVVFTSGVTLTADL
jgi:hypothetical protein